MLSAYSYVPFFTMIEEPVSDSCDLSAVNQVPITQYKLASLSKYSHFLVGPLSSEDCVHPGDTSSKADALFEGFP